MNIVSGIDVVSKSEVIGRVGTTTEIACPAESGDLCSNGLIDWRWRPLDFNGWGWNCFRQNNSCSWEWDQLNDDASDWRSIFELDTVDRTVRNGLQISNLGMHDNRQYAAIESRTAAIVHVYSVKVGNKPSYPTDIKCQSLIESMVMRCKWDVGLQSFLPWARSNTSLFYRKFIISNADDEEFQKLAFNENDRLTECDSYCTEGNIGCCELTVRLYIMLSFSAEKRFGVIC